MDHSLPSVIVTDIFGHNHHVDTFISQCNFQFSPIVISPYGEKRLTFESPEQAYACFNQYGGLDAYTLALENMLLTLELPHRLIGFSAGGSAIWRLLNQKRLTTIIEHATCFYPGQIRHYVDLEPLMDTTLIFPAFEPHFDLKPVIETIEKKQHVDCHKTSLEHGFMNQQLSIFNQQAYLQYCQLIGNKCHTNSII